MGFDISITATKKDEEIVLIDYSRVFGAELKNLLVFIGGNGDKVELNDKQIKELEPLIFKNMIDYTSSYESEFNKFFLLKYMRKMGYKIWLENSF